MVANQKFAIDNDHKHDFATAFATVQAFKERIFTIDHVGHNVFALNGFPTKIYDHHTQIGRKRLFLNVVYDRKLVARRSQFYFLK